MNVVELAQQAQSQLNRTRVVEFLAPLALRLYLAPILWMAGTQKLGAIEETAAWFGNPEWGLGLPFPLLLAWLAALTETVGAVLLVAGLGVRWVAVPLMVTMLVAIFTVHWENGWAAIASSTDPEIESRIGRAKAILEEYGNYKWLTEKGGLVILNNGIEFGVTYLVMLLSLFFTGAGAYASLDYWIAKKISTSAE